VEAVIENVDEKKKMYAALDGMVKKDASSPPTRHRFR